MPRANLPVWYLQAGIEDAAGKFDAHSQASAVLVATRKNFENGSRKVLLTVQHALRTGANQRTGPYYTGFRTWPPGVGYNSGTAIPVSILAELTPDSAIPLAEPEDLAFLLLPADFTGSPAAILLEDALCQPNLDDLDIAGYISGENLIKDHASIVEAAMHPNWRFVGMLRPTAVGILGPGNGQPAKGVSGGGVFHKGALVGIYRGTFTGTGEHLFLPITRLREWCKIHGYELVSLAGAIMKPPSVQPPVRQRQLDTPELLQALANRDPLVCFKAAEALKGRSDLGAELIDISGSRVVEEAVRTVFRSFPKKSADLLVAALKDCGITGETWFRARRASVYCTPAHRPFAEKAVVDLLRHSDVEVQRHVFIALGQMGALAFYTPEIDDLLDHGGGGYYYQKCFSYALEGSACNFALAEDDLYIGIASRLLLHLMDLGRSTEEKGFYGHAPYALPLGKCSVRHVDEILTTWLKTDSPYVQELALGVLSKLRVARSAGKILEFFRKHRDGSVSKRAAAALWCIGESNSVKTLLDLGVDVIGEGLLSIDEDSFDHWLPQVLQSNYAWLAYRAIGLRKRTDKTSLLRDGLSDPIPVVRGSASLALAQLGEPNGLKKAYEEAHNADERIFTALAVLTANLIDYATLEQQLRADLAQASYDYAIEAQDDIVTSLRRCGVQQAKDLAQAWAPFYGRGEINIYVGFSSSAVG